MSATDTQNVKYIACASVMSGCPFEASATSEDELLKTVAIHAAQVHGITEITPELAANVKAAIQDRRTE